MKHLVASLLLIFLGLTSLAENSSAADAAPDLGDPPWQPDLGNGRYRNPIIFADYSDPDVIRVGDDYYFTASSFNCTPGLPILHSKDLVNWQIIGHAIENVPGSRYDEVQPGCGVWAPAIRFHAGKFWIFFPTPDEGIYVTTASDPAGEWSKPYLLEAGKGLIDPCPLWDDDGQAYLVHAWAKSRSGTNSILTLNRMSPDGTKLLDDGRTVFDGHRRQPNIEGPKLYKRDGYYYIFAPAGGVAPGWQAVLRSTNIFGPYEDRIVLAQHDTEINGPHQGAWVQTSRGEDWFIHFQDRGPYGRVALLEPMKWVGDWPVMGESAGDGSGRPVLTGRKPDAGDTFVVAPQTSDEFGPARLGGQWQWNANYSDRWFSLMERPGWLRLYSVGQEGSGTNLWLTPNVCSQKFPAPEFVATTGMDFRQLPVGGRAGLVVHGMDSWALAVEHTAQGFQLVRLQCREKDNHIDIEQPITACDAGSIQLRVKVTRGAVCEFSYSLDGRDFKVVSGAFPARAGKWIGAKVGLFCISPPGSKGEGWADFEFFRVSALTPTIPQTNANAK